MYVKCILNLDVRSNTRALYIVSNSNIGVRSETRTHDRCLLTSLACPCCRPRRSSSSRRPTPEPIPAGERAPTGGRSCRRSPTPAVRARRARAEIPSPVMQQMEGSHRALCAAPRPLLLPSELRHPPLVLCRSRARCAAPPPPANPTVELRRCRRPGQDDPAILVPDRPAAAMHTHTIPSLPPRCP